MTASYVLFNVSVGGMEDCPSFEGRRINVMSPREVCPVSGCLPYRGAVPRAGDMGPWDDVVYHRYDLEAVAGQIERDRQEGPVLVHCRQGLERSPLAVMWWMHRYHALDLEAGYQSIRFVRPQIFDRRQWITDR